MIRIELRREKDSSDRDKFWTYFDGHVDHLFYSLAEAEKRYEELQAIAKTPPRIEVIKSIEI